MARHLEEIDPPKSNYKSSNSLNVGNVINSIYQPLRQRFYDNIRPDGWSDGTAKRVINAVINKPSSTDFERLPLADDLWATYLQIPYSKRHSLSGKQYLSAAKYLPTKGNEHKDEYYKLNNISPDIIDNIINSGINLPVGKNKTDIIIPGLGEHTIGKGRDSKGDYISYYDKYDLDLSNKQKGDSTLGIGKPFNVYDRIYLDDYFGINSGADKGDFYGGYLPEINIIGKRKLNNK